MHKGVFVWNVKNKKINPKITQRIHVPGCPIKEGIREFFYLKTEKWLDNRGFRVYTALVSHNGLVRQKGSLRGMSGTGPTEKFVQNAGLLRAVQAELCVSAQIRPAFCNIRRV